MAASPQLKVFRADGTYVAAFKFGEDAAAFVAILGDGATIRHGHAKRDIVWREGQEDCPASESYDQVAIIVESRIAGRRAKGGA